MGFHKDYPDGFEDVWKVYPNKKNKAGAYKAWEAEGFGDFAENALLIHHIMMRARMDVMWHPDNLGRVFIPHLQTFINQRRWEDEYTPRYKQRKEPVDKDTIEQSSPEERRRASAAAFEALKGFTGSRH